jgi:hypothetical protein
MTNLWCRVIGLGIPRLLAGERLLGPGAGGSLLALPTTQRKRATGRTLLSGPSQFLTPVFAGDKRFSLDSEINSGAK